MATVKAGAVACFALVLAACDPDTYCDYDFGTAEVESVTPSAEGTEVIVAFHPADESSASAEFYVEHMTVLSSGGVAVEVLPDRRISVKYEQEPESVDVVFEISGCAYDDRFEITMSLDFDSDPDGTVTFDTTSAEYGSCNSVSPVRPRGSAWVGVLCVAAGALAFSRRRRSRRDRQAH